jgi:hypothetical protein
MSCGIESWCYKSSPLFGVTQGKEIFTNHFRTRFSTEWCRLTSEFEGIRAETPLVKNKTANYTTVRSQYNQTGMILNFHLVDTPNEMARLTRYRRTLNNNGQFDFYKELGFEPFAAEGDVLGVLLIGPRQSREPSILRIGFPPDNSSTKSKYLDFVDLTEWHIGKNSITKPSLPRITPEAPEDIDHIEKPQIRPRPKTVGE